MELEPLEVPAAVVAAIIAHAHRGVPDEACGLLVGPPDGGRIARFEPCENVARSAKVYSIDPDELDRVTTAAIQDGLDVLGTMHSHTHTDAYPSATDRQMALPWWIYLIVSLRHAEPMVRAYRVVDDEVTELALVVT